MKKFFYSLVISALLSQTQGIAQVRVGIAGGTSIAKIEGRISGDGRAGFMGTMIIDANLGRSFSFYPTISYVQKGVVEPNPMGTLIEKQYVALRYAEFSPNLIYHI